MTQEFFGEGQHSDEDFSQFFEVVVHGEEDTKLFEDHFEWVDEGEEFAERNTC